MFGETTISHVKILNHPIETTIKNWLFRVPGQYYFGHISLIQKSDSAFGNPARPMSSPMQRLWMWLDRLKFVFESFAAKQKVNFLDPRSFSSTLNTAISTQFVFLALIQFVDVLIFLNISNHFFKKTSRNIHPEKRNMNQKFRKISFHVRCEFPGTPRPTIYK